MLGALAVATALALAHDTTGVIAIPGAPVPLSVESMRLLADDGCRRPPGFRLNTLQRLHGSVLEVGVTDSQLVVCTVEPQSQVISTTEVGRVAPEIAVLEFLVGGQVFTAELYGETYLCRIPHRITIVRVRACDASGRLLRDAEIQGLDRREPRRSRPVVRQ